jgi:hypothetical protein
MDFDEAKLVLRKSIFDADGAHLNLRLGQKPDPRDLEDLFCALRAIGTHLDSSGPVPREIAVGLAILIHFREECDANDCEAGSAKSVSLAAHNLAQEAFNVMVGEIPGKPKVSGTNGTS